ncbi:MULTISPECIES: ImcF-related family protein [Ralstonia]|uniref:ImcF-related family protein n=1 Tax=Ralstonia TaxID=48736 RepID=UPI0003867CFB|nr:MULTISPECIES: ImcF-related family protein [Ralstonia]EPX98870.1 type VI secretion protein VasK [Ralstonia sp. AU12-08]
MQILAAAEAESTGTSRLLAWGPIFLALILAGVALALVWFKGDLFGALTREAKLGASVWIFLALVGTLLLHLGLLFGGAYRLVGRVFRAEVRDRGAAVKPTKTLKRDARLQALLDELRATHGWRWRYRTPWLLVDGKDVLIEAVAPGLKHAGVMPIADAILLHTAPDGIDAQAWRRQIRQMRSWRPVDSIVHVTHADVRETELPRGLATLATDLGWAAPVTFLHAVPAKGGLPETFDAIGAFPGAAGRSVQLAALSEQLAMIGRHTAGAGVQLCATPTPITYLAQISQYIDQRREHILTGWNALSASHWLRSPLAGVLFAPVFAGSAALPVPTPVMVDGQPGTEAAAGLPQAAVLPSQPASLLPTWRAIAQPRGTGRRVGFYWPNALAALATVAAIAWCALMTVSFIGNQQLTREARATVTAALDARPQTAVALRAQLTMQQLIEKLEYRQRHGAPWYLRGGLSRNDELLAGLWLPYRIASTRNLQTPVVNTIGDLLKAANRTRADALQSQDARGSTYNALKAYLMLGDPPHSEPAFLKRMLVAMWSRPPEMPLGERDDTGQRLAGFYADHLEAHPEWRIALDDGLVTSTRNTLVTQMGLASADDTVYQGILTEARGKYADASLETLLAGADARGLFATAQTVPGIYTRAAWDGMIAAAIDKAASERRMSGDWVLTGTRPAQTLGNAVSQGAARATAALDEKRAAEDLKQRLSARYFAEYTAAWQGMLNGIRWQPAANLNDAIEQLTRLADAQTSPLIALMKAVQYQAQAGRPSQALADTLVRKAQSLIGNEDQAATPPVNPLDKSFGPLLTLMGDATAAPAAAGKGNAGANLALNGVSLSRYLTAVTTMRLKLQQIAGNPDAQAMARSQAQAVFQGKLSELSQARDDAALTAASLGTAWSGFGDAVFAQPLEAAWQSILQPAAASLNEAWRANVAAPFNAAMSGRYPFFDTNADASFAELGRYVRPDTGLIARFITTQLAGVLKLEGDHWTPNELAPQALHFDPKFLAGVRQLSTVGAQLYLRGDANERFEMMALPTPDVTRSELSVDGKQIVYFNQQERWTPLAWPGDGLNGHAGLTWQTLNAGLRQAFDSTGDWAFLRLLGRASVKQLDSTRYQLTWSAPYNEPLRYVLRTQVGSGPLELLKLRDFHMPEQIFSVGKGSIGPVLPPLPAELRP